MLTARIILVLLLQLVGLTIFSQNNIALFEENWRKDSINGDLLGIYSKSQYFWELNIDSLSALYLRRAIDIYHLHNFENDTIVGRSYVLYGLSIQDRNVLESIDALQAGLKFYKSAFAPDHQRIHSLYYNLADKYFFESDLTRAQSYLDTAASLQVGRMKSSNWARVLNLQAMLYSYAGDIRRSLLFLKAAEPYIERDKKELDYYKLTKADIYREFDDYESTIDALLSISDKSSYASHKYSQLAQAYISLEKYDSALYYLRRQLKFPKISNNESNWTFANMAIAYDLMGDWARAIEIYDHVQLSKCEGQDSLLHLQNISNILFDAGRIDESINMDHNMADDFLFIEDLKPADVVYFYSNYFRKLRILGPRKFSEITNINVIDVSRSVDNRLKTLRSKLVSADSRVDFSAKSRSFYDNAIAVLVELNSKNMNSSFFSQALQFIEATKALVLQEEFAEKRAEESHKLKYRIKYEELEEKMERESDLEGRLAISDSIFYWLQKEEKDSLIFANEPETQVPDLASFINEPDVVYLNYFQHEDSSLTIVGVGGGQTNFKHIAGHHWFDLVSNKVDAIRNYSRGDFDVNNQSDALLFEYLLPFNGQPLPRKLVIVPDGILTYFPFEIIMDGEGKYLLEQSSISYSFSLAMHQQVQQYSFSKGRPLIIAPHFEGDVFLTMRSANDRNIKLGALQYNRKEAEDVLSLLDNGHLLLDEYATVNNFFSNCSSSPIIHIATHAFASEDNNQRAQILFDQSQEPSAIYLSEIYNHRIPANMVVMSACQTAIGRYLPGEGVMSFARAFTAAGSKTVVASLWSVNDESTAEIMVHFYQYLKAGDTKDDALRKAKLQYLRQADPTFRHPYFWAGFIGIGDMSPLSASGALRNNLLFALGVILLLLVLYYASRNQKAF